MIQSGLFFFLKQLSEPYSILSIFVKMQAVEHEINDPAGWRFDSTHWKHSINEEMVTASRTI